VGADVGNSWKQAEKIRNSTKINGKQQVFRLKKF
jgi:hypothetical protein